ncbi:26278_t:CDS:1 [Gigaspora margarita]|uniref:26278_t:CDS:1 n=1 Tax=Gigaspora margarita TaxID=4874 RepID=A0ABM8W4N7_GIGMA|nr:26278_t:CDS:1 [Gigaspora margarita]
MPKVIKSIKRRSEGLKKPQEDIINGICTSKHLKRLMISFLGNIKSTIKFRKILKESDEQKESDLVKLTLQYFYKATNYNTTINLKQVIYNKSDDKFKAKKGTIKYIVTRNNNEIEKKYHKMENLTIEFSKT